MTVRLFLFCLYDEVADIVSYATLQIYERGAFRTLFNGVCVRGRWSGCHARGLRQLSVLFDRYTATLSCHPALVISVTPSPISFCAFVEWFLTGAVFGDDRYALRYMEDKLINSAGVRETNLSMGSLLTMFFFFLLGFLGLMYIIH